MLPTQYFGDSSEQVKHEDKFNQEKMVFDNAKLNTLLKTFSEEEWKQARWYVEAVPGFKNRPAMLRCLHLLHSLHADAQPSEKQALFNAAFPDRSAYDDLALRRFVSDFCHCLEEFLTWRQIRQDDKVRSQLLLRSLRQRNAGDLFLKKIKLCLDDFLPPPANEPPPAKKSGATRPLPPPPVAADDFSTLAWLLHERYFHQANNRRASGEGQLLAQAIKNQELAFLIRNLCYRVELEERRRLLGEPLPEACLILQPDFLKTCSQLAPDFPPLDLLLKLLDLVAAEDQAAAFRLAETTFHACEDQLGDFEWAFSYNVLINIAIRLSNDGDLEEHRNVLRLHQAKLNRRLKTEPAAQFSVSDYLNIFYAACMAQDFLWAEDFERNWMPRLPQFDQETARDVCRIFLLFQESRSLTNRRENMNEARLLLLKHTEADQVFQLRLRLLQLLIYYESPHEVPKAMLLGVVESFERFLRGKAKVAEEWRQPFLVFLKYFRQLVSLRSALSPGDSDRKSAQKKSLSKLAAARTAALNRLLPFEEALRSEEKIRFRSWLLEKVQELQ